MQGLITLSMPLVLSCSIGYAAYVSPVDYPQLRNYKGIYGKVSQTSSEPLLSEVIERERSKWGLPKGLIEGQIFRESKFDGDEKRPFNPESKSQCYRRAKTKAAKQLCGSHGLLQISWRLHGGQSDSLSEHIARGVGILGKHYRKTGDIRKALSAYNGTGKAAKAYAEAVIAEAKHFGFSG